MGCAEFALARLAYWHTKGPLFPTDASPKRALVPHYLPAKNPFVNELTQNRGIPVEATLGGPETMYPEFRKKLKDTYVMPPPCKTGCGGPPNPPPPPATPPARRP